MALTRTELRILKRIIQSPEGLTSKEIARLLKKSQPHISYSLSRLVGDGFLIKNKKIYFFSKNLHAQEMKDLILESNTDIEDILSSGKLQVLMLLSNQVTISQIIKETGMKKSTVYAYLILFKKHGIVTGNRKGYSINEKLWKKLKEFLVHYQQFKQKTDQRVPTNAQILYKDDKKVLFRYDFEYDALLTAFSRFPDYGIKLYLHRNTYRLPKKRLTIKDIYTDALDISKEYRDFMFDILFYLKNKSKLKGISHKLHKDILLHVHSHAISYLPPLSEIKQKAEDYGIKWQ